jgi:hypothetical protein
MTNSSQGSNSGDGSRPTTSGGVDNIGAGEKFTDGGPAPHERMQDKRKDAESSRHEDSTAYNLHENLDPVPNPEPGTVDQVVASSDPSRRP